MSLFITAINRRRITSLLLLLLLAAAAAALLCPRQAEATPGMLPPPAVAKQVDNPPYQTSSLPIDCGFLPYLGTHYYDVFLQDYLIGRATVEVSKNRDEYQIKVNAKTRSILSALYKIRYQGEATMQTNPLTPRSASIEEKTGSKTQKYEMDFAETDRVTVTQFEQNGMQPPTIKEKEFQSEKFLFDPFSTVYLIRSIEWQEGLVEIFDVVTGRKHYELLLTCVGTRTLNIDSKNRPAWEVRPQTRNLEKESLSHKAVNWSIYVSRDEMREILKIEGHPKIGRVVAKMRKFEKIF